MNRSSADERGVAGWLAWPAVLAISLLFVCPLLIIFVYSFLTPGEYGGIVWKFSIESYLSFLFERDLDSVLVFNGAYLEIFGRSFGLAGMTAFLCLLIGFPVAYFMVTRLPAQRDLWIFLITIPFWTNLLVRTYGWLLILRSEGLVNNAFMAAGLIERPLPLLYNDFSIALGLVYAYLPFMILPVYAALDKFDFRLAEAARDLYAGRGATLWRVVIPAARPGIIAGLILVFVPALGAYITPDLMGGGKRLMIGNLIQMQFGASRNWPFGAALAMILMAIVLAALVIFVRSRERSDVPR